MTYFLVIPFSKSSRARYFSLIVITVIFRVDAMLECQFLLHYYATCLIFCYIMKCSAMVFPEHFAMKWYISLSWSFKIVVSMDLVSMVVDNKEPVKSKSIPWNRVKSYGISPVSKQLETCHWRSSKNVDGATEQSR